MVFQLIKRGSLFQVLQLTHHHSHSPEVRSNGWIMHKTLATGEKTKWKLPMLGSHIPLLFNYRVRVEHHQICLDSQSIRRVNQLQDLQPNHHLNLSWEVRSSGWIMLRILATGVKTRWKLLMPGSHTCLHFSWILRIWLHQIHQTCMVFLVMLRTPLFQDLQPNHHLNLSWEVRSNGWIMLRILVTGVTNRWL